MGVKNTKITSHDRTILELKLQRDKLKQKQKRILGMSEKATEVAREALRLGNKRGALLALKKKKYQQRLSEKTETQIMNLEELTQSIEFALIEKDILSKLDAGNNILKELNKEMSIEKVDKLLEDTQDAISYQNEISELLSGKLTNEDENEILKELEEITADQLAQQLPNVPTTEIPIVP
ncbi:7161_t:CDS:2, partial [Diversispora eburnea]